VFHNNDDTVKHWCWR